MKLIYDIHVHKSMHRTQDFRKDSHTLWGGGARNLRSLVVICNYRFRFDDRDFKCSRLFDA